MADPVTDAWRKLDAKVSIPSEMRTAEWAMAPQWIRERSFFMAGVSRAEILEEFRGEVERVASGESGETEALSRLQRFLEAGGYQPLPGQEGTIKDLRTNRRILTSLRTNVQLLNGWSRKEQGMRPGPLRAFPAWELRREFQRKEERIDWEQVWTEHGGTLYGGKLIALKTSDIWRRIGTYYADSIGVDYPPLRWGSGLGWRAVPRREALALGLLEGWTPPEPLPVRSPNESLEVTPKIEAPKLREALADHMEGLAEWRDGSLVFTDPNGTRPYSAEELAAVWKRPMPAAFSDLPGGGQMQREAFLEWASEPDAFWNEPESGENKIGRRNLWEDLLRSMLRIRPGGRERLELSRVVALPDAASFNSYLDGLRGGRYRVRPEMPAEGWSAGAATPSGQGFQVILKLPAGHGEARDVAPLLEAFADQIGGGGPAGEIVLPSWAKLRVAGIGRPKSTRAGSTVEVVLEEVAR